MVVFPGRLALAVVLAALCLGGRTASAQAAPVPYWTPGWPLGFGGNLAADQSSNTYGNFPGPGGIRQDAGFGNFGSFTTEGMQFGYSSRNASGLPFTVYAGFDTLKFNTGIGNPFSPFESVSGTAGYSARAGIEFQPASNLSL